MNFYLTGFVVVVLFVIELIYFNIANRCNIIDKPNHRSSHTQVTIRGGGIIFVLAPLLAAIFEFDYPYFLIGLIIIAVISFVDDVKSLSNILRIGGHVIAVTLLFFQVGIFSLSVFYIPLVYVFVVGVINAVNFMDGINGITGGYGLVTLCTLWYLNTTEQFARNIYLITAVISVFVFCYFNFRKKAKCFAGDVGSISLSFIILFFILQLILKTQNLSYILLLIVYGLDTATTVIFRLIKRENVFEAHRSHFYQFLANEKQMPQIIVAFLYMLVQGITNILLLTLISFNVLNLILCIFAATLTVVFLRVLIEGKEKLLKKIN